MLGEDAGAGKLLELLEGEITNTVDGDPVESAAPAKLPIEQPLIKD